MIRKKVSMERLSHIGESLQPKDLPLRLGLTVIAGSAMVTGKVMLDRIPFKKRCSSKTYSSSKKNNLCLSHFDLSYCP